MGLQAFERRLERLVEGGVTKAVRSGLQPLEIGRRLVKELDAGRTVGVHGVVAPNHFVVVLSPADAERFASFRDALARELADAAREHARSEQYGFVGPVKVDLVEHERMRIGTFQIDAQLAEGSGGIGAGSLILPNNQRVALGESRITIGRMPECNIVLNDPNVSRTHAEIRPHGDGFLLDGVKWHVPFAAAATQLVVLARTGSGDEDVDLFLVDPTGPAHATGAFVVSVTSILCSSGWLSACCAAYSRCLPSASNPIAPNFVPSVENTSRTGVFPLLVDIQIDWLPASSTAKA